MAQIDSLGLEAYRVIVVCRAALAIPKALRPPVDNPTIASAGAILAEAKAQEPENKALAAIHLDEAAASWWTLLNAMDEVTGFLENQIRQESDVSDWEDLVRSLTQRQSRQRARAGSSPAGARC